MERAACALFGVVTYGVHLNAYVRDPETGEIKIWTPRRARNKHTYPGMLDNCVAGGLEASEAPLECLVRECAEEASLPEALIRERARPVGTVTYFHVRTGMAGGETGLLQPECQYVYDVELPADVVPQPGDDEVEEFYLWSVDEVRAAMARGEFKPNCAVVVLDWLVRWGFLSEESERDYAEVVSRCHRLLEFPMR
jgi:8-oxo-dGTP pyrophosphatase MutT (NUDIX family)